MIGLAGGVFFDEFDFGNELPGTPQKAVDWAEPPFPPMRILVPFRFFCRKIHIFIENVDKTYQEWGNLVASEPPVFYVSHFFFFLLQFPKVIFLEKLPVAHSILI